MTNAFRSWFRFLKAPVLILCVMAAIWLLVAPDSSRTAVPQITDTNSHFKTDDVALAITASQNNEPKFNAAYKGQTLLAKGAFKDASKDGLTEYNIRVDTGGGVVTCHSADPKVIHLISTLDAGQEVSIYGVIDDTWMGDLQLVKCGLI